MDSSLLRGNALAATYPSRGEISLNASAASGGGASGEPRSRESWNSHAPVYVKHADGELLWRKGRLLRRDKGARRCLCLVEASEGGVFQVPSPGNMSVNPT